MFDDKKKIFTTGTQNSFPNGLIRSYCLAYIIAFGLIYMMLLSYAPLLSFNLILLQ